jgi:hypothetical protein
MIQSYLRAPVARRAVLAVGLALGVWPTGPDRRGGGGVDPEAEKILRAMSSYLGGLQSFTVKGDVDDEIITTEGQKLQLSSSASLAVERPNHLYAHRQMPLGDIEAFFDGQTLTLHGKGRKAYVQFEVPGTIDEAVTHLRAETGLDAPAGDLFYADPFPGLMTDVTSGAYFGIAYVNGTECHHLAFRASKVDWQIWVQTGDRPLPMKYVIASKWITGSPSYSVRFRDWDTAPAIEAERFKFVPPEGTKRLEEFPVDVMGGLLIEGRL